MNFDFLSRSGCILCDELNNNSALSVAAGLCANSTQNFVLETDNFVLLPDISPIVPGHSLLITRRHFSSFARVPQSYVDELRHFIRRCRALSLAHHSDLVLFEHGSSDSEMRSGACIHHAHIHLLPVAVPALDWMREHGRVRKLGDEMQFEFDDRDSLTDYLAFRDGSDQTYILSEFDRRPPCQFIRRRIAEHLDLGEWHWDLNLLRRISLHQAYVDDGGTARARTLLASRST